MQGLWENNTVSTEYNFVADHQFVLETAVAFDSWIGPVAEGNCGDYFLEERVQLGFKFDFFTSHGFGNGVCANIISLKFS